MRLASSWIVIVSGIITSRASFSFCLDLAVAGEALHAAAEGGDGAGALVLAAGRGGDGQAAAVAVAAGGLRAPSAG